LGYKVLGSERNFLVISEERAIDAVIVAIGDNWQRARMVMMLERAVPNLTFATAVHPRAYIAPTVQLGAGTVVMAGCVVNANCRIGRHCILNTNCSLDHDSLMESYSSLGPNVGTGGHVTVGEYTAVGLGAAIVQHIRIGPHTVVGAGATVLRNLPERVVAFGTPAKVARSRAIGEEYL
jgi:sugar O-acyltransferase (sialic acid O-acetyltransferase NeuD family)